MEAKMINVKIKPWNIFKLKPILGGSTMSGFSVRWVNLNPLSHMEHGSLCPFIPWHLNFFLCKMGLIKYLSQGIAAEDYYVMLSDVAMWHEYYLQK